MNTVLQNNTLESMKTSRLRPRVPEELVRAGARTRSENFAMDGIKIERSSGTLGLSRLVFMLSK